MKKFLLLTVLISVCVVPLTAGNITFDFYKESFESGVMESTGGFLYMRAGTAGAENNFYFHITFPVNQVLAFTKKETQVYYPDEKKAIIMENKNEVASGNFMDAATKKMDLKAMGFKLVESKKSRNKTREVWAPSNIAGSPVKNIVLEKDGDGRLLMMEMRAKNGSIMSKLEYDKYTKIGDKYMPLYIKTYAGDNKSSYQEIIKLSKVVENSKLPALIQDFKIPENTEIKRIKF